MSSPVFTRDIVFDQMYKNRVQKMTDAHLHAIGQRVFLDGINFAANIIIHMKASGVDITPETVTQYIEGALAQKANEALQQSQQAVAVQAEQVKEKKSGFKLERIK